MTKYLHTMIRVSSLEDSIAFFEVLGLREIRRRPDEKGRYTNVFLAAPGDEAAAVELLVISPTPWTTSTTPATPSSRMESRSTAPRVTAAWPSSARRTGSPSNCYRPVPRCRLPSPGPA